ncbi:MAG: hypothetical protein GXO12_02055 [Epsilonproteobacteria bacterium]|nr:hypothetical protein [Campylobacterota bacterium]
MRFLKKVLYMLFCFLLFIEISVYFLPKEELFYFAQRKLNGYYIGFYSQKIEDKGFKLKTVNDSIKYDKLDIANIKEADLTTFVLWNDFIAKDIRLSDVSSSIVPRNIEYVKLIWSPFSGYKIKVDIKGDLGVAVGYIDILHKKIVITLKPSNLMKKRYYSTLRGLKKIKAGYKYVKSF